MPSLPKLLAVHPQLLRYAQKWSAQLMSKERLTLSALPFRLFWKRVPTSSRPSGRLKAPVLDSAASAPGLCFLHSIDESSDGSTHIETPQ